MTSYQLRVLASFSRTEAFLNLSRKDVFSNPKSWELVEELHAIIEKITSLSPVQSQRVSGMDENNAQLEEIFQNLRAQLLKITRTARALEDENPQLRSLFTLTRSPSFSALAQTARRFIRNSTPEIQSLFIQSEFQPDYLDGLNGLIQQLEAVTGNRSALRDQRAKATSELKTLFERGMVLLRKLDAAFRNKVTDPALLEQWREARNVELIHRRPSKRCPKNEPSFQVATEEAPVNPVLIAPPAPEKVEAPQPAAPEVAAVSGGTIVPAPVQIEPPGESPQKPPAGESFAKRKIPRKAPLPSLQEDFFQALDPEGT